MGAMRTRSSAASGSGSGSWTVELVLLGVVFALAVAAFLAGGLWLVAAFVALVAGCGSQRHVRCWVLKVLVGRNDRRRGKDCP